MSGSNAYSGGGAAARMCPSPASSARAALACSRAAASRALPTLCGTVKSLNSTGSGSPPSPAGSRS